MAGLTLKAWTGGTRPPEGFPDSPETEIMVLVLYLEQLGDWFGYWEDWPDADTAHIFWSRACYDTWATIRPAGW